MATTSTIPAFKTALVTAIATAMPGVQVAYRWPGPSTKPRGVYLGDTDGTQELASIVARDTRAPRNERYELQLFCHTYHVGQDPITGPADAEADAFSLLAEVEDVLADDPTVGSAAGVASWSFLTSLRPELEPFEKGWRCRLTAVLQVTARLT